MRPEVLSHIDTDRAIAPSVSMDLVSLLGDVHSAGAWDDAYKLWQGAVAPADFIDAEEIERLLTASLIRWPYFTVLQDGRRADPAGYTVTRDVIGQSRGGFADPARIRRLMRQGATLKLSQLSDWHRPTREAVRAIEKVVPAAVATYVFWTPSERRGMLPHRDAAHVLVLQLEGRKEWRLYAQPGQIASTAGLDVDARHPSHTLVLEPGDALYLPHGWPHDANAVDGSSLHLTFTLTEPTPDDLVEAVLRRFEDRHHDLVHRHHARTLRQKSEEVRAALAAVVDGYEADAWLGSALSEIRKAVG
ncbi:JmjC domain-containing protein [Streptomyces sp. NPDC056503]|uniref:JmjC domain-containing protein n=1 Tax=Streptomyces sp. NPDC056503 TaxID=3345842 RepID=UPI00369958BC